ncbi:hypothetical protein BT96DRAFT_932925 [Gymnopus androsaceus JB14]|uniref:F-box domain-containing protein n=1 Tax=Gymnopus androsaceus JB14 TaxID=1447944 RepID=A0A6A4IDS6_9AGAR|nr:hypothetical protein BT96DRAFT_932925 [Gymnopus androsaceus JB14]
MPKKQKLSAPVDQCFKKTCHLEKLPVELLSWILLETKICGDKVDFFSSYGLRVRLTLAKSPFTSSTSDKLYLRKSSSTEVYKIFQDTLPVVESTACFNWTEALQGYLDATMQPDEFENYMNRCAAKSAKKTEYMKMCVEVYAWKVAYLGSLRATKEANNNFSKELATTEGLNFWDMMNTPTYSILFKRKNKSLEKIEQPDYNLRRADIATDLLKVTEHRTRRAHEIGYSHCRRGVEKHYNRLRALQQESPLPCLPTFRALPTIHQLQNSTSQSPKELDTSLQSKPIQTLVRSELVKFHVEAKNALGVILGFPPDWKSPSSKKAHPVDRLTARFRCRTCQRVEAKYKAIAAMSALLEACSIPSDEIGSHDMLSEIGSRVLCMSCDANIVMEPLDVIGHSHRHETMSVCLLPQKKANEILGDHPLSRGLVTKLMDKSKAAQERRNKKVFMCRHCIQVKPKLHAGPGGTTDSSETNNERSSASGSIPVTTTTSSTAPATDNASSTIPNPASLPVEMQRPPKLFIFDGLRSHLKEVHKVDSIRDEDFICDGVLDSTPPLLSRMDARKRNVVGIASDGLEHILINANMYSQFRRDRGLLLGI